MSEPTVTMTLSRYKELEAKELAFEQHQAKKDILLIRLPYGSDYYYSATLDEVFAQMKKEIEYVSGLAETWRVKAGGVPIKTR